MSDAGRDGLDGDAPALPSTAYSLLAGARSAPPREGFVESAEVRLHYLEWPGDGAPVLLVHATGFHAWLWAPYAERLTASGHRVVALDQRGHGDSSVPTDGMAWTLAAEDVHRVIEELDLAGCAAAGHSSGGTAVGVCASRHPGSISRLVLIDPVAPGAERAGGPNPMAEGARRRRAVWESPEEFAATMATRRTFAAWMPPFMELYAHHGLRRRPDGRYELKCPPELEAAVYEGASTQHPWPDLERIAVPTLLLRAVAPNANSPTPPDTASRIPGTREVTIHSSHFIPMEAPDAVQSALDELEQ